MQYKSQQYNRVQHPPNATFYHQPQMHQGSGSSPSTNASSTTECSAPEMGVLPPALMLTTVRIVAPAPATPPNNPATVFPTPCDSITALLLLFWLS